MDTEKRLIIAIVLALAVLLLYPYFLSKLYPPPPPGKKEGVPTVPREEPAVVEKQEVIVHEKVEKEVPPEVREPIKEELVTVETPLFKAVFTNVGAAVKSLELKRYRERLEETSESIDIVKTVANINPLETRITSSGLPETISFEPSKGSLSLSEDEHAELVFSWDSPGGISVERKYTFTGDSYAVGTELKIINGSSTKVKGEAETLLVASYEEGKTFYHNGPVIHSEEKAIRQKTDSVLESGRGVINWLGLEDKYFLLALIPEKDVSVKWETEFLSAFTAKATLSAPFELGPGEVETVSYNAYMGPKLYNLLRSYGAGLEEAIEFGFLSFLAKPFLVVLNFFERYLRNYGLAIIILTCIIKVVFHPLTRYSLHSMKEMQKIQPQLNALKQKYKDNKEKLNKELMALYKRYKINPLGGCLPMLMQIPVFIALYEVLSVAIELRHAPFAFWITDLSSKDPYYVTPLLMGATMFIQQKMTPSAMDPAQAKIMLLMPIVFTFLFMSFPSGLVLYWLVNNVLSIAQQYHIYKGKK